MRDIAILILILFFFFQAIRSVNAGLYTYWWFSIFRPQDFIWGDFFGIPLPLLAAVFFIGPALLTKNFPIFDNLLAKLMALLISLIVLADIVVGCNDVIIIRTIEAFDAIIFLLIVLTTSRVVNSEKVLLNLLLVVALSLGFYSGKGGINALLTGASYYGQDNLGGFMSGSNAYALGTGMMIFIMIFCYQATTRGVLEYLHFNSRYVWLLTKFRYIILVIICGSIYNIIALESRGSFLSTVIGLLFLILLNKKRFRILALIGITLSIALTVISLPEGYEDRIKSIFADKEERDHSAAGRPHFWSTAIKMANHYPLGVGPGCFPAFYNDFDSSGGEFGFYRSVHSSHFQILADAGYLGVIVWILIYLVAGYKLIRIRSLVFQYVSDPPKQDFYINLSNALLCVILVFFIGGSFYELAYNDIIWLTFGLIITIEMKIKNLKLTERGCI